MGSSPTLSLHQQLDDDHAGKAAFTRHTNFFVARREFGLRTLFFWSSETNFGGRHKIEVFNFFFE
jgi:hypothetical protein